MNTSQTNDLTQSVLAELKIGLSSGLHPQRWWQSKIIPLSPDLRRDVLRSLAGIIATEMTGLYKFLQRLEVKNDLYPSEFESILFDFLLPIHHALVNEKSWDEAIALESVIYNSFIKQREEHDFYERSFSSLYLPYSTISGGEHNALRAETLALDSGNFEQSSSASRLLKGESMLFWLQNYSMLAHTGLALDLATYSPIPASFYVSAISNVGFDASRSSFDSAKLKMLPIDDRLSLTSRCHQLVEQCKTLGISNIVFVSLPLQSGYLKTICDGIHLTWWSMKYPLGCMPHFDRLVCNRTLYPTQKNFNGAVWNCAPFALKPLLPHHSNAEKNSNDNDLKLGVLSREEKFASSNLPEVLNRCLLSNSGLQLFWTGRHKHPDLNQRLNGSSSYQLEQRIHFCGWVDPSSFLMQIDILVDTPNLGGMVAYWMMSMGKVVVSATDSGSIGSLGSREDLSQHLDLLSSPEQVDKYFSLDTQRPYYLSDINLIPHCIEKYCVDKNLQSLHGLRFLKFFREILSDMPRWSGSTYKMLQSRGIN